MIGAAQQPGGFGTEPVDLECWILVGDPLGGLHEHISLPRSTHLRPINTRIPVRDVYAWNRSHAFLRVGGSNFRARVAQSFYKIKFSIIVNHREFGFMV